METLHIAVDARGVARVTMTRPEVFNAFNGDAARSQAKDAPGGPMGHSTAPGEAWNCCHGDGCAERQSDEYGPAPRPVEGKKQSFHQSESVPAVRFM